MYVFWIFPPFDTAVQLESADSKQNAISKSLFQDSFWHIFWAMRKMHHTFWKKQSLLLWYDFVSNDSTLAHSYSQYFNFRKDWILTTICITIIFVSLPLIWLKRFLSKKIDKRIPRSNIVPTSIESTSNQTFGTKSSHGTSPITAIEPILLRNSLRTQKYSLKGQRQL